MNQPRNEIEPKMRVRLSQKTIHQQINQHGLTDQLKDLAAGQRILTLMGVRVQSLYLKRGRNAFSRYRFNH